MTDILLHCLSSLTPISDEQVAGPGTDCNASPAQEAALRGEAAQATSAAATAATSALADLRKQCEQTVAEVRQQAAARLEEADSRHDARLAQAQVEAMRKVELLQGAHLEAMAAAQQDAAAQQARPSLMQPNSGRHDEAACRRCDASIFGGPAPVPARPRSRLHFAIVKQQARSM